MCSGRQRNRGLGVILLIKTQEKLHTTADCRQFDPLLLAIATVRINKLRLTYPAAKGTPCLI
jgi:hypothetical protein